MLASVYASSARRAIRIISGILALYSERASEKIVEGLKSKISSRRYAPRLPCGRATRSFNCERSELPSLFNARIFYIFIYIFQAVRRAVNEMFETPDTVFNNLELLVNPSSTAKKCSATEDCCRNPGGDRRPSSTVKYCSATGLLPNRQRGERPGVNGLPFSHRRKETPVFNKLQLLVNRRLRQNRRKRNKPVFNS